MKTNILGGLLVALCTPALAGDLGRTFPIQERSLIEVAQERAANAAPPELKRSYTKTPSVPIATEARVRYHVPFYTLDVDIPRQDGTILYPAGYTFNPLEFVQLPYRVVVITDDQIGPVSALLEPSDLVVFAGSDFDAAQAHSDRPIFAADTRLLERFDIRNAPSIITQQGARFEIQEIVFK